MSYRWVANRSSAREAAKAFHRATLRRPRWWVRLVLIELVLAFLLGDSIDRDHSAGMRALLGLLEAIVPTIVIALVILGLTHLATIRRLRGRLTPGVALESSFGSDHVELRGPRSETKLCFDGLETINRDGDWVQLAVRGSPFLSIWPGALFPPDEFDRVQRRLATPAAPPPAG